LAGAHLPSLFELMLKNDAGNLRTDFGHTIGGRAARQGDGQARRLRIDRLDGDFGRDWCSGIGAVASAAAGYGQCGEAGKD
jgi:hypothetical protein